MCPYDAPKYSPARGIVRKCDMCRDRLAGRRGAGLRAGLPQPGHPHPRGRAGAGASRPARRASSCPGRPRPTTPCPPPCYRTRPGHPAEPAAGRLLPGQPRACPPAAGGHAGAHPAGGGGLRHRVGGAPAVRAARRRAGGGSARRSRPLALASSRSAPASFTWAGRSTPSGPCSGLRTSWLSREALGFGLFAGPAAAYALSLLSATAPGLPGPALLAAAPAAGWEGDRGPARPGQRVLLGDGLRGHPPGPLGRARHRRSKFFGTTALLGLAATHALVEVGAGLGCAGAESSRRACAALLLVGARW